MHLPFLSFSSHLCPFLHGSLNYHPHLKLHLFPTSFHYFFSPQVFHDQLFLKTSYLVVQTIINKMHLFKQQTGDN